MKVYFQDIDHYIGNEFIQYPPEGIDYSLEESKTINLSKKTLKKFLILPKRIKHNLNIYTPSTSGDIDLYHTYGSIYPFKESWVISYEEGTAFSYLNEPNTKEKRIISRYLKRDNCKSLLALSEAAQKSFINIFDPEPKLEEKCQVLYPAFNAPENYQKKEKDKITFLFVARDFERKGGYEAFRSFKKVKGSHDNLEFLIVSDAPEKVKEESGEDVKIFHDLARDELMEKYREADIFVYPSFHDTFGFVMLEAMGYGLPIISIDGFARDEIIKHNEDGFIIEGYDQKWYDEDMIRNDEYFEWEPLREEHKEHEKNRIVKEIAEKMNLLIENDQKREKFSERAREKVESGKFSIETRNKKLKNIYEDAVE